MTGDCTSEGYFVHINKKQGMHRSRCHSHTERFDNPGTSLNIHGTLDAAKRENEKPLYYNGGSTVTLGEKPFGSVGGNVPLGVMSVKGICRARRKLS